MTVDLGPQRFAASRQLMRAAGAAQAAAEWDAALAALIEARSEFAAWADEAYEGGAHLAGRDSDRLECVAERLLAMLDSLQPAFDRLDIARDISSSGVPISRVVRSPWDRRALAAALCETFGPLLAPPAYGVMSAAVSLEACR